MAQRFLPQVQTVEELHQLQLQGLQWTVQHAYHGSAFYRQRLQQAGIAPEAMRTLDDLRRLPLVTARDLQEGYPFPLQAVPFEDIVRVHASSGTTGKKNGQTTIFSKFSILRHWSQPLWETWEKWSSPRSASRAPRCFAIARATSRVCCQGLAPAAASCRGRMHYKVALTT